MRFEQYLLNEGISSIIANLLSRFAGMKPAQVKYHLNISWYDFVDTVRKRGNEREMVEFINKTFHQSIESLDDVNLQKLKLAMERHK
jgi:hypothetical protein